MGYPITVLTTALPGRGFLAENIASIEAQTFQPAAHLIGIDYQREGCAVIRNRMLAQVSTPFVCALDDDDTAHPNHLQVMLENMHRGDVIWTDSDHNGDHPIPRINWGEANLADGNFIPVTALMRTDVVRAVGGWREDVTLCDWGLYVRLEDAGARFVRVPEVTWFYRWHDSNHTGHLDPSDLSLPPEPVAP